MDNSDLVMLIFFGLVVLLFVILLIVWWIYPPQKDIQVPEKAKQVYVEIKNGTFIPSIILLNDDSGESFVVGPLQSKTLSLRSGSFISIVTNGISKSYKIPFGVSEFKILHQE